MPMKASDTYQRLMQQSLTSPALSRKPTKPDMFREMTRDAYVWNFMDVRFNWELDPTVTIVIAGVGNYTATGKTTWEAYCRARKAIIKLARSFGVKPKTPEPKKPKTPPASAVTEPVEQPMGVCTVTTVRPPAPGIKRGDKVACRVGDNWMIRQFDHEAQGRYYCATLVVGAGELIEVDQVVRLD